MSFISKVYGILTIQLVITVCVALPFHVFGELQEFVIQSPTLLWLTLALGFGFLCILTCCPDIGRAYPSNYFLLGAFTLTEGILIGVITAMHQTSAVLLAVCVTLALVAGLTYYSVKTKSDWTGSGPYLFVALLCLLILGFTLLFVNVPFLQKVHSTLGALLFSFYLVYDTQIITGGKHQQFRLEIDEYVFAALALYLDIINLFLYILNTLSGDK